MNHSTSCAAIFRTKRGHQNWFTTIDQNIVDRYLTKNALGCFARVKPSESRKTLSQVSKDLFELVQQFKQCPDVSAMYSYKLLERVLKEQCNLSDDKNNPVELKALKEIASDSLQNPSDPDATYSGHKGQGYQVQIMETFSDDQDQKEKCLNLITHVEVEPAHNSDANALVPAIEAAEEQNLKPQDLIADSLYGSGDNCEYAKEHEVELIAPAMGAVEQNKLSIADFRSLKRVRLSRVPAGRLRQKSKREKRPA